MSALLFIGCIVIGFALLRLCAVALVINKLFQTWGFYRRARPVLGELTSTERRYQRWVEPTRIYLPYAGYITSGKGELKQFIEMTYRVDYTVDGKQLHISPSYLPYGVKDGRQYLLYDPKNPSYIEVEPSGYTTPYLDLEERIIPPLLQGLASLLVGLLIAIWIIEVDVRGLSLYWFVVTSLISLGCSILLFFTIYDICI